MTIAPIKPTSEPPDDVTAAAYHLYGALQNLMRAITALRNETPEDVREQIPILLRALLDQRMAQANWALDKARPKPE